MCGVELNGSGCKSGRENATAMEDWSAARRLMTMSGVCFVKQSAILEGIRNAKLMIGYGSNATEVNEERVAPWNWEEEAEVLEVLEDVTTATG